MAKITAGPSKEPNKRTPSKPVKESETYMTEGLCIGLCLGTAAGVSVCDLSVGMSLGMMLGLAVGACIKKKPQKK